jgi:hypothetical protein
MTIIGGPVIFYLLLESSYNPRVYTFLLPERPLSGPAVDLSHPLLVPHIDPAHPKILRTDRCKHAGNLSMDEVYGAAQQSTCSFPLLPELHERSNLARDPSSPTFEHVLSSSPEATHIVDSLDQKLASKRNASPDRTSQTTGFPPRIPESLARGVPMIKISNRKIKQRTFRLQPPTILNPALGELVGDKRGIEGYATICWESRKIGRGE